MSHDESGQRNSPQHDSDYDGAWKEALREHFPEIFGKFFPIEHALIDWSEPLEWCDKELSQVIGRAGRRNREVDVLVKARLTTGSVQMVFLHLEIQTAFEEGFAVRLGHYNAGLYWLCQQRVLTLVLLADLRRGWVPNEDLFQIGSFESRIKFPTCKLIDRLETDWLDDNSLPVILARAQVEALRTASDPEARYASKWTLLRSLYGLGYDGHRVRGILKSIDWMMHLRDDLAERLRQAIHDYEEEQQMPYVTSFERLAEARGEARGKVELIMDLLTGICGELPDELAERVRTLSLDRFSLLAKQSRQFQSVEDLKEWLNQQPTANG